MGYLVTIYTNRAELHMKVKGDIEKVKTLLANHQLAYLDNKNVRTVICDSENTVSFTGQIDYYIRKVKE